jgi:membrane-bound lytic murein transglycosylase B
MNAKNLVLVALICAALPASGHTPEERSADLAQELKEYFEPTWIDGIFNHQNLCSGREVPQEVLRGGWAELEAKVMSEPSLKRGEFFFRANESAFRSAGKRFGDEDSLPYIILAILRIESNLGENRKGVPVARKLFEKYHAQPDGPRGNKKRQHVFEREILPFFQAADENGWDVCGILGSRAMAFGYPHFIPGSLRLSTDGNGDGKTDIVWDIHDATHSVGNYLNATGWHQNSRRALFAYNRDWRYVAIVEKYANEMKRVLSR